MKRFVVAIVIVLPAGACSSTTTDPTTVPAPAPAATVASGTSTTAAAPSTTAAPATASTSTSTTTTLPPGYPALPTGDVELWTVEIRATYPHDAGAFTQGLVFVDGRLYESTGLYGESTLREVTLTTGEVTASAALEPNLFGEGLAYVDDRLVQLTFRENTAIVWSQALEELDRFSYDGEGWGLCDLGGALAMSDGSETLMLRDRTTFEPIESLVATLEGDPVGSLNELECVDGLVFANVWKTTYIVVIDPADGQIRAVIDAAELDRFSEANSAAVLNGIAYDAARGVFYLTGKLWPMLYEVTFVAS